MQRKNQPKYYFILSLFLASQLFAFAQIGPHSASIEWQQINTNEFRVIFPKKFDQQGLRVANLVNYMEQNNKRSIGELNQKINIVLHNQTTIPNGFVGIAPFRSEFFATPPQSANLLGTVDWLDALAVHEYRHALQFSNAKVGITKLFATVQGENGWGLAASAAIPSWFWEGDATIMETALSKGGRGRVPFFTISQRANSLNGKNYKYQKARNGSFKDIVPDRYPLGYAMLMYGRTKYGNDFWQSIFDSAARYKPLIYPFSNALKRETGLKTKDLYQKTFEELNKKWRQQYNSVDHSPTQKILTKPKKTVTNYRFPYPLKDNQIICLKSSFQKTDALILIKDGNEKKLSNIGFHTEKYLSVVGTKAVWTEYEQDPRRSNLNYSNIVFYDLKSGDKTRLTSKGRYFSPSFSHSQGRIVSVHITHEQKNTLVILNAQSGKTIGIIPNPENLFLAFPKWAENDTDIVYIGKKNSQLAIFKYNLIEKKHTQLTNWTHHTMADLFVKNKMAYFTASFSGIDNIYRVDLAGTQKIEPLTSLPIGGFYPALSLDNKTLVFSEFTDRGFELSQLKLPENKARQSFIRIEEPHVQKIYSINQINEEGGDILENAPSIEFPIIPYKGFFKGLSIHSWNFTPSVALPLLDIQVDNYLNDFSFNFIAGYNINEASNIFITSATYGKFYPQLTVLTSLTNRNTNFTSVGIDTIQRQEFQQFSVGGRVSVPLTWLKGNYRTSFTALGGYFQRNLTEVKYSEIDQPSINLGTVQIGLNLSHLRRTAFQNLGPRWGQSLNLNYQQTVDSRTGRQITVGGNLYFPGIGANHNLKLGIAYQRELLNNIYQFTDTFEFPRGFGNIINDEFLKLSADYQFPIAYPDLGTWGVLYLKRVSLNTFFDYGRRSLNLFDLVDNQNSVGVEVIFDTQFFNELPVSFGIRNAYLLTEKKDKYQYEFFVKNFLIE